MNRVYELDGFKIDKTIFDKNIQKLQEDIKQIMDDSHKKLEMEQICNILDNKANIEDINRVFQEFHSELLKKIGINDFKNYKTK